MTTQGRQEKKKSQEGVGLWGETCNHKGRRRKEKGLKPHRLARLDQKPGGVFF